MHRKISTMLSNPGVLHTISCAKYAAAFFKISRSWGKKAPLSAKAEEDKALTEVIKTSFNEGRECYGTRRIQQDLIDQELTVSRRRIGRLMKTEGMQVKTKRKFKATPYSDHDDPIAPNLLNRALTVDKPDTCYVGDITYIATREGWLYLATVIDLYSRRVVGWSMADNMRTSLVNDALSMALNQRKPANDLLWHSDRGSQYASESHRALLTANGITQSMSRKGNCWDNAVAESFFHSLKTELVHHCDFATRAEAKQEIFEYIEVFYNRKRRHSANDYKSPADYEMSLKAA
jgi:transposase InsO family protein